MRVKMIQDLGKSGGKDWDNAWNVYQRPTRTKEQTGRRIRKRERTWENIWRNNSWKLPHHEKANSQPNPGSTESPWQDNPRRNTPRHTIIKLIKIKDKDKILTATREKRQITYKGKPIRYQLISQQKFYRPERNGKWWKGRTHNHEYSTQKSSPSDLMKKSKAFQTSQRSENSAPNQFYNKC